MQLYRTWYAIEDEQPDLWRGGKQMYEKEEVDAAIAAKDAEIERYKRAVEWILFNGAALCLDGHVRNGNDEVLEVQAEFADIIKPAAAVGQEGRE